MNNNTRWTQPYIAGLVHNNKLIEQKFFLKIVLSLKGTLQPKILSLITHPKVVRQE